MRLLIVLRRRGVGSGVLEDTEAWEARKSEVAFHAASNAEQSYTQKSTFDSIDFWSSLMVLFNSSMLFCWIRV